MGEIISQEKELYHKPFIVANRIPKEGEEVNFKIQIGRIPHPMELKHFIEWVEIYENEKLKEKVSFNPELDNVAVVFYSTVWKDNLTLKVRTLCNVDGMWEVVVDSNNIKDIPVQDSF